MGELITTLGIDGKLLIAQLINFLVLFFLLRKFLYGPLLGMLEKRKTLAEESLAKEKELSQSSELAEMQRDEILSSARDESRILVESARMRAEEVAESTRTATEKEIAERIVRTEEDLAQRRAEFDIVLKKEAADLVTRSLKKIVPKVTPSEVEKEMIEEALKHTAQ